MTFTEARKNLGEQLARETSVTRFGLERLLSLDSIVAQLETSEERKEFQSACALALETDLKNSVAARYLATMSGKHPIDDRHILTVFEEFAVAKDADSVLKLGTLILTFNENPYVLKTMADCCETLGDEENKLKLWERFVRVDHEDTDILARLGDRAVASGEVQKALGYYRRAIKRLMAVKDVVSMKGIWEKVMDIRKDNPDYLINFASRIAETIGYDKGVSFLHSIAECENFDRETKILVHKRIIEFNPHDKESREMLVELWRIKYQDNPRLAFCLDNTGIMQDYMDVKQAIKSFEKEIEFIVGAFVWHDTWGIGRIMGISQDEMELRFVRKGDHKMSCQMAFKSLKVLPKSHIWVLKAAVPAEKLKAKLTGDVEWGLRCLIQSFGNAATIKQMKDELVPEPKEKDSKRNLLDPSEWSAWQTEAKKILSTNEYFGIVDGTSDTYTVRTTPISFEEKQLAIFNGERDFFSKVSILREFMAKAKDSLDSDEFGAMVTYFLGRTKINDAEGLCAWLLVKELSKSLDIDEPFGASFMERYLKLTASTQPKELFKSISDNELKKDFILTFSAVCEDDKVRQKTLVSLFPVYPCSFMEDCITSDRKHRNDIYSILSSNMQNYKDDPDFLIYLMKNHSAKEWNKAGYDEFGLLIGKLQLLLHVATKIDNAIETSDNKKRQKQLDTWLFDNKEVESFLKKSDADQARKIYSLVNSMPGYLNKAMTVKHIILTTFDNGEEITRNASTKTVVLEEKVVPKGLLCTRRMKEQKIAELDHIMNVEIPENSKEIGTARELGDLRENAEYQYAKDKQKNLNFLMNTLSDELDRAQVRDADDVDASYVSFGTEIDIHDNNSGKDTTYVVLGPWESDPDRNILNFQSPLGNALYFMALGETKAFEINGTKYDITVNGIRLAKDWF